MLRLFKGLALLAITGALVSGVAFAQTPPFWFFLPSPSVDQGTEKRIEQKGGRKKLSACKKQARVKKIESHWNSFISDCMAK